MLRPSDIIRSSAMIRRSCTLLAVVGLFLQGSTGGHMLLVEHTRCAEHGDLVHGDQQAHEHAARADEVADVHAFEGASDTGPEAAHEHCSDSAERRDAAAEIKNASFVALVDSRDTCAHPASPWHPEPAPRYRTAPKNSPPA